MIELLRLCGFEEQDIESGLPRMKRGFERLGIGTEDIERAKQRLNKYYDMELQGVRKSLGLCIKEVVDTVLAREDYERRKIIYYVMAPAFEVFGTALATKSKDLFLGSLTGCLHFVLGCIFDKLTPVLEAAEHKWLRAGNVQHCANPKGVVGLLALNVLPKPDLLVTSGLLCDTAPKTVDLIGELYDIPTWTYDTCHDREFKDYPDSKRFMEFTAKSGRLLAKKTGEITGYEITDEMILESLKARGKINRMVKNIMELQESSNLQPVKATHDILWMCVASFPHSIPELEKPLAVLNTAYEELSDRVQNEKGAIEKGAYRVLSLNPPHFADPRWEYLPYEYGMAIVSNEAGFFPPGGERTLSREVERPNDPYEMTFLGLQASLDQSLSARIAIILEVCKRLKIEGVLNKYHLGCRMGAADALLIKESIVNKLNLPVLQVEWEGFDPRACNEDQYRENLESFKLMLENSRRKKES